MDALQQQSPRGLRQLGLTFRWHLTQMVALLEMMTILSIAYRDFITWQRHIQLTWHFFSFFFFSFLFFFFCCCLCCLCCLCCFCCFCCCMCCLCCLCCLFWLFCLFSLYYLCSSSHFFWNATAYEYCTKQSLIDKLHKFCTRSLSCVAIPLLSPYKEKCRLIIIHSLKLTTTDSKMLYTAFSLSDIIRCLCPTVNASNNGSQQNSFY